MQAQGARVLSESEMYLIVQQDPAYTLHYVLNLRQYVAPVPAFFPLQYSLIGFTDTQDIGKWLDLLLHWLHTFDPIMVRSPTWHWLPTFDLVTLFIRRIDSEAPLEAPKQHGFIVSKLSQTSKKQTVTRGSSHESSGSPAHDQLTMLARCLPFLLL